MADASITAVERECRLATDFAKEIRTHRWDLVAKWLESIASSFTPDPRSQPTPAMVDRMAVLVDGIAWYLEHPDDDIRADTAVPRAAAELGAMRHEQGCAIHEILDQYGLLARVLFDFLAKSVNSGRPCDQSDLLLCGYRLFHAIRLIEVTTTTHFLRLGFEQVAEREGRLRAFNRAVSHEIKNRIGTIISAGEMLCDTASLPRDRLEHFADIVTRNAQEMRGTVDNLLMLARLEHDPSEHRALLPAIVQDVANQVQHSADAAGVSLRIVKPLPDVEVSAAVRLMLANYVTNAIKYSDPAVRERYVQVDGALQKRDDGDLEVVVRVRDNGLGVPVEKREALFGRFFRAHEDRDTVGMGLGLSIVREVVTAIGGRAWAEFPDKGSIFSFAVPLQRADTRRSRRQQPDRRLKPKTLA